MREIRFRAWSKIGGFMLGVGEINFEEKWFKPYYCNLEIDFAECIFMQYTGLKDKNGKEIYEEDVVKFSWGSECSNCHKTPVWSGKVTFGSLGARVQGFLIADPQNNILGSVEIIGNIHRSPELI